ncbi:Sulfate adenylyltransferase [hydrothermal vent metagenome]|uniref:Sulfate adenylyltransferase n=1 Tax=hydrothermal vent metagenome TaxID=652676 RepID=A0A1W1D5Z0_9ZZZZ
MISSKRNKTVFIDNEAASALKLLKDGLLAPLKHLMNKQESQEVLHSGLFQGVSFPFPFILAPAGKKNEQVISSLQKGEMITLICDNEEFAVLEVDEIFEIDSVARVKKIYGTDDFSHPGVQRTLKRLGSFAISGEYQLLNDVPNQYFDKINECKKQLNAKHISSLFMAANPLHRAHERLIRNTLDTTDLLVIFLLKPYGDENLSYTIRKEVLEFFITHFLPKNRIVIVPLENSYLFAGFNEIVIDAIVAKNYGCHRVTIGSNHAGLGVFYDTNLHKSVIDNIKGIDIDIEISSEYVYCDKCTTLVSTKNCPHGKHHHISYRADSILTLLELGLVPPAVLMRKEISAFILSKMHPNRIRNLEKLYYDIFPVEGLLQEHNEKDFYIELMKLYQTTSLT